MKKNFYLAAALLLSAMGSTVSAQTTYNLNTNTNTNFGSFYDPEKWYYFSFESGDVVGTSTAVIASGTEVIDETWTERNDWDIAFHGPNLRTNSGTSGEGLGGAVKMDVAFEDVTTAPESGYSVDRILNDETSQRSIFGMNAMPPTMAYTSQSEASFGWVVAAMSGNTVTPTVLVVRTATGKYAKVYLKEFDKDGLSGNFVFDYFYQADGSTNLAPSTGLNSVNQFALSVYPNPASDFVTVDLSNAEGDVAIEIYGIGGKLAARYNTSGGNSFTMPVKNLAGGNYVVKIISGQNVSVEKLIIK